MPELSFRALVWTLSASVDLVGIHNPYHGRRTAYVAREIALRLDDLCDWTLEDITTAALLHDMGVSSTEIHECLVREMEWSCVMSHCQKGYELLYSYAELQHLAEPVRLHHRRWNHVDRFAGPSADEWLGNLIFLADRFDVLCTMAGEDLHQSRDAIMDQLYSCGSAMFNPEFLKALQDCARRDAFWLGRENTALERYFKSWMDQEHKMLRAESELLEFFALFGLCVDGKSHFTVDHSSAVAELSYQMALWAGLDAERAFELKLAGYVHDIGKLRVPDQIMAKPEHLEPREFALVRRHGFDAYEILAKLKGFEEIARWVALHNERLDGSGYPYHLKTDEIPMEARILAIADTFQAMAQNRPYRRSMDCHRILQMLGEMADLGQIDADLYALVIQHQNTCMDLAYTRTQAIASPVH